MTESPRKREARTRADTPALLRGLLYGPDGAMFSPTHTRNGALYRNYVSQTLLKHWAGACPVGRVPAGEIEAAVFKQSRTVFRQPEIVAGTRWYRLDPLWDDLFPAAQARIVSLLVERVDIGTDDLHVRLRIDGLAGLVRDMSSHVGEAA